MDQIRKPVYANHTSNVPLPDSRRCLGLAGPNRKREPSDRLSEKSAIQTNSPDSIVTFFLMKKTVLSLVASLLAVGSSEAARIAWVSFHSGDNTPSGAAATAGFTQAPDVG